MNATTEADRRYRMLVVLERTDKPDPFKWHCPRCTRPVAELVGYEVRAMSDVLDDSAKGMIGIRCDGRLGYPHGRCNSWYYFRGEQ